MPDTSFGELDFLVADASAHMRKLVRAMLTGFGANRVYEVGDGAAALEIVEGQMPHILICDIKMPIINGVELMRMIRNPDASENPYIPIIVATAQSQKKTIIQVRDSGATEALSKPFSITGLYRRVQNVVINPRKYVEVSNYFGPDRRRKADPAYSGPHRRHDDLSDAQAMRDDPQ